MPGYLVHFFNSGAADPYGHCKDMNFASHVGVAAAVVTCPFCRQFMKNKEKVDA